MSNLIHLVWYFMPNNEEQLAEFIEVATSISDDRHDLPTRYNLDGERSFVVIEAFEETHAMLQLQFGDRCTEIKEVDKYTEENAPISPIMHIRRRQEHIDAGDIIGDDEPEEVKSEEESN